VHVRTEAIRPAAPPTLRLPARPGVRDHVRSLDPAAGLLGALTTLGLLVLSTVILVLGLLLSVQRGANALTAGLTDASITTNLLMALLLGGIVLVSFGTGGYVAARLAATGGRAQGLLAWACATGVPTLAMLFAATGNSAARTVLDAVTDDPALLSLVLSVAVGGLLGALLGADAADRQRSAPRPP
jgi:hypothetical protein